MKADASPLGPARSKMLTGVQLGQILDYTVIVKLLGCPSETQDRRERARVARTMPTIITRDWLAVYAVVK